MLRCERNAFVKASRVERPGEARHRNLSRHAREMREQSRPIESPRGGEQMSGLMIVLHPDETLGAANGRNRRVGPFFEED
jgi:hypothetical protein